MPKKKFSETKVGKFLKGAAPKLLNIIGDVFPSVGILSKAKDLIQKDTNISKEDKDIALKLLEIDVIEMQEVSKRWASDMASDSWLSKNVRPLTLVFFSLSYVTGWFLEYSLDSITGLLSLIIAAYFGSRGFEKIKSMGK
tara:strand:+ start:1115 stop:1534 length:420 start_codon:yes stop_codon:yes gene_type:complete